MSTKTIKYNVATLAEALGVHRNTVRNMILRGELASLALKDVLEYVEKRTLSKCSCAKTQSDTQEHKKGAD